MSESEYLRGLRGENEEEYGDKERGRGKTFQKQLQEQVGNNGEREGEMSLLKCPLFWYRKGNVIKCRNKIVTREEFESKEEAVQHRKRYCETMDYDKCPIYKRKVEVKE